MGLSLLDLEALLPCGAAGPVSYLRESPISRDFIILTTDLVPKPIRYNTAFYHKPTEQGQLIIPLEE